MAIYPFLRLEFTTEITLGPVRTMVLESIAEHGSISAAARALGISTRWAWAIVKAVNATFPSPLVNVRAGGRSSGASLTPLGAELVARYRAAEAAMGGVLAEHLRGFEELLGKEATIGPPRAWWSGPYDEPAQSD